MSALAQKGERQTKKMMYVSARTNTTMISTGRGFKVAPDSRQ